MNEKLLDIFTDIAEYEGWYVSDLQDGDVEVSYDSPAGEEFNMILDFANCECLSDMVKVIQEYWEGYDPDYEASLWIGEDGHGHRGAPYHIEDIVKDKKAIEAKIEELWRAVDKVSVVDQEDAKAYIVYSNIVGNKATVKGFNTSYRGKYGSKDAFCEEYFSEIGDNDNSTAWDDRVREFFGTGDFIYQNGFVFEGL